MQKLQDFIWASITVLFVCLAVAAYTARENPVECPIGSGCSILAGESQLPPVTVPPLPWEGAP